jgi:hypothetical protein
MKQLSIIFLLLFLTLVARAQNGGQFFENNVIHVSYLGYSSGVHIFKVRNKQNCEARIRTKADQDPAIDIQVASKDSAYAQVTRNTPMPILFRVKAETACVSNPDMGWLEINTAFVALPLSEETQRQIEEKKGISVQLSRSVLTIATNNNVTYNQTVEVYSVNGIKQYYKSFKMNRNSILDLHNQVRLGLNFISIRLDRDGIIHRYLIRSFY